MFINPTLHVTTGLANVHIFRFTENNTYSRWCRSDADEYRLVWAYNTERDSRATSFSVRVKVQELEICFTLHDELGAAVYAVEVVLTKIGSTLPGQSRFITDEEPTTKLVDISTDGPILRAETASHPWQLRSFIVKTGIWRYQDVKEMFTPSSPNYRLRSWIAYLVGTLTNSKVSSADKDVISCHLKNTNGDEVFRFYYRQLRGTQAWSQ
jgi:hypothetical protein